MTKPKKQLALLISTYLVPLGISIKYAGGFSHRQPPIMQRVLEFRLGELESSSRQTAAGKLSRGRCVCGPWDISAAVPVPLAALFVVSGGAVKRDYHAIEKTLATGNKAVAHVFGPNRAGLFDDCMKALGRFDLVGAIPPPNAIKRAI